MPMFAAVAAACLAFSLPAGPPRDALMQVRMRNMDTAEMEQWLRRRPFAAALPIQPMLIKPLDEPLCGIELTFRRKPNSEKGGQDGGMRFTLSSGGEEEDDDSTGTLLVTRVSEGQYTAKIFSELKIMKKLVQWLETVPAECGDVVSVVNLQDAEFESM